MPARHRDQGYYALPHYVSPSGLIHWDEGLTVVGKSLRSEAIQAWRNAASDNPEDTAWITVSQFAPEYSDVPVTEFYVAGFKDNQPMLRTGREIFSSKYLSPHMQSWLGRIANYEGKHYQADLPPNYEQLLELLDSQNPNA